MIDTLRQIDGKIPLEAKLAPMMRELDALIKSRWQDLTVQERRALETAITGYQAALSSIKIRAFAKRGALGPKRDFSVVPPHHD